jgi:hypothetical protein
MSARTGAPSARIPVRLAAFGTLSNGSDVRLLAAPKDDSLSSEARASIETFFYKAWRGSRRRTAPYFAFLPLDHAPSGEAAHWGLMRVSHLGAASMGAVLVVWVAILATRDLDQIGWQTHRLWSSALPEPRLPEPGEKTASRMCDLGPAWNEGLDAYLESFEAAAFALCSDAGPPRRPSARILVDQPASAQQQPLTHEGALFGVWSQLGHWCADLSYCTWGEIDDESQAADPSAFHVLIGPSGSQDGDRLTLRLGGAEADGLSEPSAAWLMVRQMETGIASASELLDLREDQAAELARDLFAWAQQPFRQNTFSPLERLLDSALNASGASPGQSRMLFGAIPRVLEHAVTKLDDPARTGILEFYLRSLLPRMKPTPADPNPAHTAARIALAGGVVHRLSDQGLEALGSVLFDMPPGEHDLLEPLLAQLRSASPEAVNWTGLLAVALSDRATEPERLDEALVDLIAGGWNVRQHRAAAEEGLAQFIDSKDTTAALAIIGAAAPEARRGLFAAIATRRPRLRPARSRRDPARPRALVASLRLLNAGTALARHGQGSSR